MKPRKRNNSPTRATYRARSWAVALIALLVFTERSVAETFDKGSLLDSLQTSATEARRTGLVIAAEKVMPSVVSITVLQKQTYSYSPFYSSPFFSFDDFFKDLFPKEYEREIQGLGSGFILTEDGKVITNAHVVADATTIKVTLANGETFDAAVIGLDEALDLALLELKQAPPGLKPVKFGNSDDLMIGEWAIALGNPFGFLIADAKPSVTVGVISASGRRVSTGEGKRFSYSGVIQTDAAINPGNSGGPLTNIAGEVIGINSFIFTKSGGSEGLGFAIPINQVKKFIYELESHESRRLAWLGIGVQTLTSDMARALGIPGTNGIIINQVFDSTPASQAKLSEAWVIISANGINYASEADWQMMEQGLFVGDSVQLQGITDQGKSFTRTLFAAEYEPPPTEQIPSLGIEVMDLDPATRYRYNIRSREGVYITAVKASGEGANLGISEGDVILAYGNHNVANVDELKKAVKAEKEPASLIIERDGGRYRLYRGYY
ncbi:trypsin-like peptidase domain-containing protein [candidate division WOR-3 bacterium]|nr:trypsin-like peptidase domain-containing protein [candidate division WOR-3 bacterium]